MRQLATIQKIKSLDPIPNADAIERATVLGWQLVVKKGEFKVDDICVYCEIDSVMPDRKEFEFLKPLNMRVRTVRMRGQISQGICFPLSILSGIKWLDNKELNPKLEIGSDVTEILGITKHEDVVPAELAGKAKGYMPVQIPKTDVIRVQSVVHLLEKYEGELCYATEKLDGESFTIYGINGVVGVCSKDVDFIQTENSVHWNTAIKYDLINIMEHLTIGGNMNIALQGELIGEGIKGNKYKIKGKKIKFFNVFDINKHKFYDFEDMIYFLRSFNLDVVPVIHHNFKLPSDVQELVKMSIGASLLTEGIREGIIVCPMKERVDMTGRIQMKVINPEFLIKHKC